MVDIDNLQVQNTNVDYSRVSQVAIYGQNPEELRQMNKLLKSPDWILLGIASGCDADGIPQHTFAIGYKGIDGKEYNFEENITF